METKRFRCRHCHKLRLARVKNQKYCGEPACQRARKNAWRREKYACDPDYRINQKSSTEGWLLSIGGAAAYHREYRKRKKQHLKEATDHSQAETGCTQGLVEPRSLFATCESAEGGSANRDAIIEERLLKPGRYVISPLGTNRDAIVARIEVISIC
ncbi:MAG: hypothetical protein GY845_22305 [Planctomycetes bacterium]|nr:hypothetical protein [Planctomycetota bacterium]